MREIKFRALAPNNKGVLVWYENVATDGDEVLFYAPKRKEWTTLKNMKVIVQFIGLLDKKGIEIYEGDIVKSDALSNCVVKYNNDFACFMFGQLGYLNDHFTFYPNDNIEVIGNIYENSELLQ